MKPWDPIILAAGAIPVAPPIHVLELPPDDLEANWWAHLLAALWGLRTVYSHLGDTGQAYRTGKVQTRALEVVKKLYFGMAEGLHRAAMRASAARIHAWAWHDDPLELEAGWWAQAAFCAHALAAGYTFAGGADDARALLAADVLRLIRERVACALPEHIAYELLEVATSTRWSQSTEAQATGPVDGTEPAHGAPSITLEQA